MCKGNLKKNSCLSFFVEYYAQMCDFSQQKKRQYRTLVFVCLAYLLHDNKHSHVDGNHSLLCSHYSCRPATRRACDYTNNSCVGDKGDQWMKLFLSGFEWQNYEQYNNWPGYFHGLLINIMRIIVILCVRCPLHFNFIISFNSLLMLNNFTYTVSFCHILTQWQ